MYRRLIDILLMKGLPQAWRLAGFGLMGCLVAGGLYVGRISNAISYMSDDPKACINCHIMEPMYATWERSSHGPFTNCNDCHVPHDSLAKKLFFKAKDGGRHSLLFTLRKERQVITAIPESKEVIQANCLRCHGPTVAQVGFTGHGDPDRSCVECHREVPHGRVHSLSATPNASVPPLSDPFPAWMMGRRTDSQETQP